MGTERKEPAPERGESTPRTAVQSIGQRLFFWRKIRKEAPMENDRNVPAAKGDVADILEALRDVETRLLNAFRMSATRRPTTSGCSKSRPTNRCFEAAWQLSNPASWTWNRRATLRRPHRVDSPLKSGFAEAFRFPQTRF